MSFVVRELHLIGVIHATAQEQHQIAASLIGVCLSENEQEQVSERLRDAFQRLGFFKAAISGVSLEAPNLSVDPPTVSVRAQVKEGGRYRLKAISFAGNTVIRNTTLLRSAVPIKDGDIFNTQGIREGLEELRQLYGELGYINFTPVPDTQIDDQNHLIALNIDMSEGDPFYLASFTVQDTDLRRKAALAELWPGMLQPGKIYNQRLVKWFFAQAQARKLLPPDANPGQYLDTRLDQCKHTVDLVLTIDPE